MKKNFVFRFAMHYPEDIIIEKFLAGDEKVFEFIFNKYYTLLCYEAKGYFKDPYLIEEIVCDVFSRIWQKREQYQIRNGLKQYLIKSVHNNCIDYIRRRDSQDSLRQQFLEKENERFTLIDLGENPLDYIITDELEKFLSEVIENLPEQYKKAFKLSRYENLSYEEIAKTMDISVNSVKLYIKNALSKLRERLEEF